MKRIIAMTIFLLAINAQASDAKPTVAEWVTSEINGQVEAYNETSDKKDATIKQGWYFNVTRVRIRATVGLDLLAKFEVKPYIDLHFVRGNPENWPSYVPQN